jgi:hypothetical protein
VPQQNQRSVSSYRSSSLSIFERMIFGRSSFVLLGVVMNEHRKQQRQRVLKAGMIALDGGAAVDCIVRNISEAGASLEIESPVGIPNNFTLVIKADKFTRPCHIAWRKARRIGIRFD